MSVPGYNLLASCISLKGGGVLYFVELYIIEGGVCFILWNSFWG